MSWGKCTKRLCEECRKFYCHEGYRFCARCSDRIRNKIAEKYDEREMRLPIHRNYEQKERTDETKYGIDD